MFRSPAEWRKRRPLTGTPAPLPSPGRRNEAPAEPRAGPRSSPSRNQGAGSCPFRPPPPARERGPAGALADRRSRPSPPCSPAAGRDRNRGHTVADRTRARSQMRTQPGPEFRFALIGDRTGGATPGVWESVVDQIEMFRPGVRGQRRRPDRGLHRRSRGTRPAVDRHRRDPGQAFRAVLPLSGQPRHHHRRHAGGLEDAHALASPATRSTTRASTSSSWTPAAGRRASSGCGRAATPTGCAPTCREHRIGAAHRGRLPQAILVQHLADGREDLLHRLFRENGVDYVFNGHFHNYGSATYDGIRYTILGSSGGGIGERG